MSTTDFHYKQSSSMIDKIISVDNEELEDQVKQKLNISIGDAQYLLEKKKREQDKREKVKKMQQDFVQKMQAKRKAMSEKETKSQQFREKQREQQDKKLKYKSKCYQKVVNKIQNNHKKQIRSALKLQKQYINRMNSNSIKIQRSHGGSLISSRKSQPNREQELRLSVEDKMARIVDKTNRAQKLHEYLNNVMVQKFKMRARVVQETQQRFFHRSLMEQQAKYRNIYEKNNEMERLNERSKDALQRKNSQRVKSMKQKLNKYQENIKQLSMIERQRNRRLDQKYNKKYTPKKWKDQRGYKYQQKFMNNYKKIDQEKQLKAQIILHKHQQISLENKIYKQQKDKLIQAVKFSV